MSEGRVAEAHPSRLFIPCMDTVTAPPAASSRPHLPEPHAHIIDARLTKIEDVARDTKLYTFQRARGRGAAGL